MRSLQAVDVVFINPGDKQAVYQDLGNAFSAIEPPSLAGLFAGYLRKKGISVALIDAVAENFSAEEVASHIVNNYKPLLIVIVVYGFQPSASTQNMQAASVICKEIKKQLPYSVVLITGTHPAALPQRTLLEEAVDFVCDREGPETILHTILALKNKNESFTSIPSLWYRVKNKINHNPPAALIRNLDEEFPGVAWDLLPMKQYRAHNWHCFDQINDRQPYASIHTSLGCPFKCSFCCINAPFGGSSYRVWSPESVIKEIDILVNQYGIKNIKLVDEMFVLKPQHVLGICDLLIKRDYGLNIWAYARVDTIRDEFLDKLQRAGFRWLALGIESGSKHVRDGVEKGRFDSQDIINTVKKVQNTGIHVIGNYIFGLPDDTYDSMQETLNLALETQCEFANFYCAMAYPGSPLYTMALKENWELPDSWIGYSQHSYETFPLRTHTLPNTEVLKFRDEAFMRYFTNANYLASIKTKFGEAVVSHIQEMTKIRLKRKILSM